MALREVYCDCDSCGGPIYYGGLMATVTYTTETIERTPEAPDGVITVLRSDGLVVLCPTCSNANTSEDVKEFLLPGGS